MLNGLKATVRVLLAVLLLAFPVLAASAAAASASAPNGTSAGVQCETCLTSQHSFATGQAPGAGQHTGHMPGCLDSHCPTPSGWLPASTTAGDSPLSASGVFALYSLVGRAKLSAAPSTPPPKSFV